MNGEAAQWIQAFFRTRPRHCNSGHSPETKEQLEQVKRIVNHLSLLKQ